ncbi:hypothetical protein F1847_00030 [Thermodesulfobacterium sp. TA1]|uniref:Ppx/GppA phosphatase family protein n=1 Tax=Thermodesulfobacterium sp. TA1 TaxID=2234087 RepID=UPI0012323EB1|nr:HU family DNA-binding protein [Thermodesulfobacterium sp. TA1]QER41201.1 hypothetical protein F1847_00030 [Thermodesulfobacterium sp. TA1]
MNRSDLIESLSLKFGDIEKEDLKTIVELFFETLKEELKKGNRIEFRDFGVFLLKKNKGLIFKNPKNQQNYYVKNKLRVIFKLGKEFKDRLNLPFLASLDLGTQTFRLCLGKKVKKQLYFLVKRRENVRLGEGLVNQEISEESFIRGIETLKSFKALMDVYEVKAYRAVGTAIFRKAKNASSFLEEAKKIGIDIEVVSPEEEILLSLKGVIYGLKDQNLVRRKCLIVDVGGGSTEFMLSEKITPKWVKSLEIGAVSLKELFQLRYPVNYRVFKSIIDYLSDKLVELPQEEVDHVIFTGGTASLLGALDLKLKIFSPYALNSHKISKDRIEKIIKKLANSDLERISKMKGMEKGREDIALPGALICFSVLEYFKKDSLILSVNGILEGTLLSLIERYN